MINVFYVVVIFVIYEIPVSNVLDELGIQRNCNYKGLCIGVLSDFVSSLIYVQLLTTFL